MLSPFNTDDIDDLKRTFMPGEAIAAPAEDVPMPTEIPESADGLPDLEPEYGKPYIAGEWDPRSPWAPVPSLKEWDAGERIDVPEPRGWLLGNQFCRRFLSGLLAAGGTGKSALRQAQYLALATGKPLTGEHVFKRCRVLMLSLEDDDDEMLRRLAAARMHHNIQPADLKGWLYCAAPKGLKLAEMRDGTPQAGQLETLLRDTISRRQIDLLGLDPFVKLHALEENDNGAMDFVCGLLVKLAIEFNIAVDCPHHVKKGQLAAGDADAGRGASSARDAGRLMYTLTKMTDVEGETFGIPAEQRKLYIRLDSSKVNISPPSGEATWFRLVGVPIGNGTPEYPSGDEVQTVERWHPPKTWDGISSAQINAALDDIESGMPNGQRYSDAPKAGERAAWKVVQRHCPNRTEFQCREIVRTWSKNGLLVAEDYEDPTDYKTRKGLRVIHGKRPS
ncbi:hypothetical protein CQ12_13880 [Bradyrhizobium jicamae]|uniref:Uncharacterized protein n=1 Tax=Bradyrhizobium jicamae TaxID=280332 RepID=A0A0R3LPA5_9BRAD|nr:AAA family ATPase [Bradyrhizobium jicamae]KRR09572.1 hypothetical protein CQ12_13880 [Bradyrhizobium jicamae]